MYPTTSISSGGYAAAPTRVIGGGMAPQPLQASRILPGSSSLSSSTRLGASGAFGGSMVTRPSSALGASPAIAGPTLGLSSAAIANSVTYGAPVTQAPISAGYQSVSRVPLGGTVPAAAGVPYASSATYGSSSILQPQTIAAGSIARPLGASMAKAASPVMASASCSTGISGGIGQPCYTGISGCIRQPVGFSSSPQFLSSSPQVLSSQARPVQYAKVISTTAPQRVELGQPGLSQQAYEQKHEDDEKLNNLKSLRKSCGLGRVPVRDGLMTLKRFAEEGSLSREQFLAGYDELLVTHNVEAPSADVRTAVFDLFDRDDNHVVDMMELICGISLLCSGSEDEKIHAVFDVFDENGDGFISMDEMFKFLTSVFKVVLTPQVRDVINGMGVTVESAEDLASVTALECFKTSDLNHDGKLSVTEFKTWFYAPRNDPSFLFSPVRKMLQ